MVQILEFMNRHHFGPDGFHINLMALGYGMRLAYAFKPDGFAGFWDHSHVANGPI